MRGTKLYNVWKSMKQRCFDVNCKSFRDYGGRGIYVCNEWSSDFLSFYNWAMNNGYKPTLTIDRVDNDGIYCPENCRWVSNSVQQSNKRNNHLLTYNGKTMTMAQWSAETGIKYQKIKDRIGRCGWSVDKTLSTP